MEESQSNKDGSKFGAFSDRVPGTALGSVGDIGLHHLNGNSEAGRVSMKVRRSSQFEIYEPPMAAHNPSAVGFAHSDVLPDEQSLASAFADMSFRNHRAGSPTNHCNAMLTNRHYPSGSVKPYSGFTPGSVTLNQPFMPTIVQDDLMPPMLSTEHVNQKTNQLTFEFQETHSVPLHGNFPRSSWQQTMNTVCGGPHSHSASPIQQQFFIDGQSQTYAPCDQQFGSNLMWQHDMNTETYPVMQQHYAYPQLQQVNDSDICQMKSYERDIICTSANGRSYVGTSNVHPLGVENAGLYCNGSAFPKRNSQKKSAFANSFPSTLYAGSSCGNDNFRHSADKFVNLYEPNYLLNGFMQHQLTDNLSTVSYPEKILVGSDQLNAVRTTMFGPSMNGCIGMNQKIDSYGHNHLDTPINDSAYLDSLNSHFLSLVTKSHDVNYKSVDEVAGKIYILAKDQNGCRFLQKVFAEGSQEDVEKVFAEIIDHIAELMMDPFGNYLVQKLLEGCSDDQRMRIICEITKVPGELIEVSCNMHGTRAVQKIVETLSNQDQVSKVVSALSPGVKRLMLDTNGSHVANRCLQKLLPEAKAFVFDAATLHYLELATDRQGCCILQKCIEHSNEEQKYNLLKNITSSAIHLSDDQFGNYVIQSILNHGIIWAMNRIVDELEGHFGYLSMQKCGSHVVENCLNRVPEDKRDNIIIELMNHPKFLHIMLDQYGNFVIQTALTNCKGVLHTAFVEAIRPHAPALQSNMYGKRVLSKTYLKNKQYRVGIS